MKSVIALSAIGFYALSANAQAAQWAQCKFAFLLSNTLANNVSKVVVRYDNFVKLLACLAGNSTTFRVGVVQQHVYPGAYVA